MLGLYLNLYKQYNQLTVLRNHLKLTRQVLERMHARREQGTALKTTLRATNCNRNNCSYS